MYSNFWKRLKRDMKYEELEPGPAAGLVEVVDFAVPQPISFDLGNQKVTVSKDLN